MKTIKLATEYEEQMLRVLMGLAERSAVVPSLEKEIKEFNQELKKQLFVKK